MKNKFKVKKVELEETFKIQAKLNSEINNFVMFSD
eukprot:CAMPEP_0116926806 /NCGR_PEP_ID=MMETSP0467-20121206/24951_1 /TAXON_ID=283647 /ORGANISM="Mesodinium pulex, Strain SPMC105" /LENGTH=34 /DNA_ID= /DNA_START= /DNA_END= /DNA_ORIENTATION=